MNLRHLFPVLLVALFPAAQLYAQPATTVYTEANAAYKRAEDFFGKGLYGQAQEEYGRALTLLRPANVPELEMLRTKSELGFATSAVRQDLPDGEKLILDFIRKYSPDPVSNQALVEVANYYYNAKKYDKAIEFFTKIPTYQLTGEQRAEVRFKTGYAYFVQKKFGQAKSQFIQIKNLESKDYYYPTNYYYGLCEFYLGNFDEAIRAFRIAEKYRTYRDIIPNYVAQIYFLQGQYDQLLTYAEPKFKDSQTKNRENLAQVIGQAYFEMEDYEKAVFYLEYYADQTSALQAEQFYQLGIAQHKTGAYQKAARNLEQLVSVDSKLGQYAMYYLGDCSLRLNDRTSARNAFGRASRMNFDAAVKEDASFNFGKLSYELGYDTDAITALQGIAPSSTYYPEAQTLMSEIFLKTRDYERALTIIQGISNPTPQMREVRQKVNYYRALQLHRDGKYDEANRYFMAANSDPVDPSIRAACAYWQGDISHRKKKYDESIPQINQFLTLSKNVKDLPEESSVYTANYTQGYNYLKQENYATALTYFKETTASINRNKPFIKSDYIKSQVLGDATLRAGDCHFKRNQYKEAQTFYNEAISNKYSGYIYAYYQKAIIEGLRGQTTDKIISLENLVRDYPSSAYADDALFALGVTYQDIGQLSKAIPPLKRLVADYRNQSDLVVSSLLRLGLISFNQGNMQTAVEYYKQVFSNNPEPEESKDAISALEEIYVDNLGDPDGYTRFLETIPGYSIDNTGKEALNFKAAESQYENANYERAVPAYGEYIKKYPNGQFLLQAYERRGESYFELKQYPQALDDFETVVEKGPSKYYTKALELAAAISYNYTLDFQKSYSYYAKLETSAVSDETRFAAQLGAMQSAYRINNYQAVLAMANKINNNPTATLEQKSRANFYLGKLAFDNRDYDSALSAFGQVIRFNNQEEAAESRYLIASIYYQRRDLTQAESWCDKAIQENSAYPFWTAKTFLLLADVYADQGNLFNARAVLESLIENYKGDQSIINEAQTKLDQYNRAANSGSRLNTPTDDFIIDDQN
ncbi:MAG: tetratricopeptide repeat protein [Saprospirales bacterium]|nr:tetratricopeptide repeat protein [Saprospirales bacterium]